jgi:hypothetical protein
MALESKGMNGLDRMAADAGSRVILLVVCRFPTLSWRDLRFCENIFFNMGMFVVKIMNYI